MALANGTRLGRYEILGPVGKGGMGEVYRAMDTQLGREAAIKVLPEGVARDSDALKRFERESRTLASLSHRNIVTIYDVGSEQDISFVVMELLKGETLQDRISKSRLPWQKAVEIVAAISEGLAAAHSNGIIHRDLKPQNVFLCSDGEVKILDFGLARQQPSISNEDVSSSPTMSDLQTKTGVVMGTVPYMSPEQAQGLPLDARSDIFSLGCILYETVTGRRPFVGRSIQENIAAILKEDPPPLSAAAGNVPPELERIAVHCLEKDANQRFQTARDLLFALKSISSQTATRSAVLRSEERSASRAKFFLWITVALLLAAAGVVSLLLLSKVEDAPIDSIAVLPFVNVTEDPDTEYLSDGITESLINNLSQLSQLRVMARTTVFTYKGRDIDPVDAGKQLKVRAVLTGKLHLRAGVLVIQSDLIDTERGSQIWGTQFNRKPGDIFAIQEEISRKIAEEMRLKLSPEEELLLAKRHTSNAEAYDYYLRGLQLFHQFDEELILKGIEYFRQSAEKDPTYAPAYWGISASYGRLGFIYWRPDDAFPKAEEAARKALELDSSLGEAHVAAGAVHLFYRWDWKEAGRELRRSIELQPNHSGAHHVYAYYLMGTGSQQESIEEMRKAVESDPQSLLANSDLAWLLLISGDVDAALAQASRTQQMLAQYPPPRMTLAVGHLLKGQKEAALANAREAIQIYPSPQILGISGYVMGVAGERKEAEEILSQLNTMRDQKYVSPIYVAGLYAGLGDKQLALDWLEKAYEERSGHLIWLRVNPIFISLHSEPRFIDLVRRMNFPG